MPESATLECIGQCESSAEESTPKLPAVQRPYFDRLPNPQIAKFWPYFLRGLTRSLPPGVILTPDTAAYLLHSALVGDVQCWMSWLPPTEGGKQGRILGVVLTQHIVDAITGTPQLLIYSLAGSEEFGGAPMYQWRTGMRRLMEYCRETGLRTILAYTESDQIESISRMLKCKRVCSVIEWEVSDDGR